MNGDKHAAAMSALNELILSELQSEDRNRFASVQRLSVIAQKLLLCNTEALHPEDARNRHHHHFGGYGAVQLGDAEDVGPNPYVMQMPLPPDQGQMVREMLAAINPIAKSTKEQNDAKKRASLAAELNQLMLARERAQFHERNLLTERIEEILKEMRKGDEDELSLVPAVPVRGHQAGTDVDGDDESGPERACADGEGCSASAISTSEGEHHGQALGVGRDALEDQSRLDVGTDTDARRADLTSSALPTEAPEAPPQTDLGSLVHERQDRTGDGGDTRDDRCTRRKYRGEY